MKLKEEMAKTFIMMIIVMTFVLPGFEHSIANMGTFSMTFTALGYKHILEWSRITYVTFDFRKYYWGKHSLGLPTINVLPKKLAE